MFAPMRPVAADSADRLLDEKAVGDWVLKNQGEGGGHCLFDRDMLGQTAKYHRQRVFRLGIDATPAPRRQVRGYPGHP